MSIIPRRKMIEVETLRDSLENVTEDTAHKSEVGIIYWGKDWHIVVLLSFHHSSRVLLVDKIGSLFFNGKFDDTDHLFIPDLLTIDIKEVLNVFN